MTLKKNIYEGIHIYAPKIFFMAYLNRSFNENTQITFQPKKEGNVYSCKSKLR